jgi:hypothetical protein
VDARELTKNGKESLRKVALRTRASLVTDAEYSPPSNSASRLSLRPDFSVVSRNADAESRCARPAGAEREPAFFTTTLREETESVIAGAVLETVTERAAEEEKCLTAESIVVCDAVMYCAVRCDVLFPLCSPVSFSLSLRDVRPSCLASSRRETRMALKEGKCGMRAR